MTRLLLENHDPSCEMLRFGRSGHQNLCQTLPKKFHAIVRACHNDTMIFVIFRTLYAFPVLEYQQGLRLWPHPAAELFEVFFPVSRTMNENSQSDTRMICTPSLVTNTQMCSRRTVLI